MASILQERKIKKSSIATEENSQEYFTICTQSLINDGQYSITHINDITEESFKERNHTKISEISETDVVKDKNLAAADYKLTSILPQCNCDDR